MKGKNPMFRIPIVEIALSLLSFWWAFVLFKTPDMFDHLPELYEIFGHISTEIHWAIVFIIAAFLKIIGVFIGHRIFRKIGLIFSFILYGLISAGFFLSMGMPNINAGTYAIISLMAIWGVREVDYRNG
jgi:hypothetical protein